MIETVEDLKNALEKKVYLISGFELIDGEFVDFENREIIVYTVKEDEL